jgi:hypothetical protein
MVDLLLIGSVANLLISAIFLGITSGLKSRAEAAGTVIWIDLGKSLVYVGICMLAQSAVSVLASVTRYELARFLWFIVFIMFALAGMIIARYCFRTNKMLATLLGGEE